MSNRIDYSKLDQPHILMFVFYPRQDWTPPPPGATDHSVPIEEGVSISCRFYHASESAPSILYFHGNGEVVYDYDDIATLYNGIGANLFVADYRGYGQSTGTPSFASTVADAHVIFKYFRDTLRDSGYNGPLFIMGRSLGSLSALELASTYQQELKGLIIESGFASAGRLLGFLIPVFQSPLVEEFEKLTMDNIRSITLPALIIHGEYDEVIPYEQALVLHENIGSKDKKLLTIPGAGHNTILMVGLKQYFSAIEEFISG
ncbi:MAG TPA: alpha/beta hydrolase [Dehalococcoidia bacterium]|nr:alpha/beta hydrolase [Dehalococcoidia bacterium]